MITQVAWVVALGSAGSRPLDRAVQGRVTMADLYAAHYRNLGRRVSAKAADLLLAARDRTASEAERLLVTVLRDAGLTGVQLVRTDAVSALPAVIAQIRLAMNRSVA